MKLIPRLKPYYTFSDWIAALNIFQKNPIERFEEEFAKKFNNKFGIMFQYGRSGIYALLKVWNLEKVEVICPAYTCVVVPNAIVLSGNIPVFVDCGENTFNMDLEFLKKNITKKTRVIIVTHIFGYPMDVEKIEEVVKKAEDSYGHKIYVIQDVAHSFGAKWKGRLVTEYGDASVFGLNIGKIINSIFGGIVITNDKYTCNELKKWRKVNTVKRGFVKEIKRFLYFVAVNTVFNLYTYNLINWFERKGFLDKFVKYYEEDRIYFPKDWNEYPSKIEARVGLSQLDKYDLVVKNRIKNAKTWINRLKDKDVKFMPDVEGATYSHCVGLVENREKWLKEYRKKGIQLGIILEYSIPYMKAYRKYKRTEYPLSLKYSKQVINFPIWTGIFKQVEGDVD